jgi:hypothetical protein
LAQIVKLRVVIHAIVLELLPNLMFPRLRVVTKDVKNH